MKILCGYSGVEFQVQHFPGSLDSGEITHPVFAIPLKRLWKYLPKWREGGLGETDSYLLFLALLNATELIEWRCPVHRTTLTPSLVASNMENLFDVVAKVTSIHHPRFVIPRFAISYETRTLSNIKYWIQTWMECYRDFQNGLQDQAVRSVLQKKEAALEKLIKNPAIKEERYAHMIADWATIAGNFPAHTADYWKEIIIKCYNDMSLISIPQVDVEELLEHCEEHIDAGSIFSFHLFNAVRSGLETLRGFFSIGSTTFSLLDTPAATPDAIETANIANLIAAAGDKPPIRTDYPTEFAFLKAKMRWNLAVGSASK